ncbi:MAG: hypothetical protein ACOVSW_07650 [Candidatus Kapaibacteriota bacterium]|jgi:hypothetical protein
MKSFLSERGSFLRFASSAWLLVWRMLVFALLPLAVLAQETPRAAEAAPPEPVSSLFQLPGVISIDGLGEREVVNGVLPMMINAYSKGDQRKFLIQGSETPRGVPAWLWVAMIAFAGWALFYTFTSFR